MRTRRRRPAGRLLLADLVGWSVVERSLGDESTATAEDAYQSIVVEVVRAHDGRELVVHRDLGERVLPDFERPPHVFEIPS